MKTEVSATEANGSYCNVAGTGLTPDDIIRVVVNKDGTKIVAVLSRPGVESLYKRVWELVIPVTAFTADERNRLVSALEGQK